MKIVVFGLTVSSSWGNGHATLWRGLIRALGAKGHGVSFFERDVPYYRQNRDLHALPHPGELVLYKDWVAIEGEARDALQGADLAIVTSFCPDAIEATALIAASRVRCRCFYDLDTPVTLERLAAGDSVAYLGPDALRPFDLVLSYTGGGALAALREQLGARAVAPLYGWVEPDAYRRTAPDARYAATLSYLGTYAADRQAVLERFFVDPARARKEARFVIGGAQYPADFPWTNNIFFVHHLPPPEHPAFFSSSPLTLNVTRASMARMGWCPSGRLFEAAACGTAVLSDMWEGLDHFFEPGREILVARTTEDALAALDEGPDRLAAIGRAARARVLAHHTAQHRAQELLAHVDAAMEARV